MHGNAAEWTRSDYRHYATGLPIGEPGRKVVRGGSWYDRPYRAASGFRWGCQPWQPVYNVGIRVIAEVR
jgi:formylglycine-generating enzyme required for sulfatase activity